ncbi:hypothetical protein D3C85_1836920 [compost metagenome]
MVTTLKGAEDGGGLIARVFDLSGDGATITLAGETAQVAPRSIATLRLADELLVQCDGLERSV